jgi:hypothetical protein
LLFVEVMLEALLVLAPGCEEVVAGTGEVKLPVGELEVSKLEAVLVIPPVLPMPPVAVAEVVEEAPEDVVFATAPVEVAPVEVAGPEDVVLAVAPVEVAGVEEVALVLVVGAGVLVYLLLEAGPQLKLIEWTPS